MTKCLIVDDDRDDQEIFLLCLSDIEAGIDCVAADDGIDAIALLEGGYVPDYIFIDVNMPRMNGIDCLRILKNMNQLQHSRIFMYSTTSEEATLAESMKIGAEEFIVKPARIADLRKKLAIIFNAIPEIANTQ